jgi:hypothetical protein
MSTPMADSIIQPDTNLAVETEIASIEHGNAVVTSSLDHSDDAIDQSSMAPASIVIWTPGFIVAFALVLVLGLSGEALVTQGSVNHFFSRDWPLLAHVLMVLGLWITIITRIHSPWIRTSGFFACIWALFAGFKFLLDLYAINPVSPIVTHLNTATYIALLGSYIGLSLDRTPFHLWDARFFQLALIIGSCATAVAYFLTPADSQSLITLENDTALTALVLSVLVWWIRPSCWKTQPGPTILFGLAPAFLLFLTIPNSIDAATNLFLSQVAFLCIILGSMRILQRSIVEVNESRK